MRTPTRRSPSSRRAALPEHAVVVVTGAASGIGAATAVRLRAAGRHVVGIDQREADVVADLATKEGRRRAVEEAGERSGGALSGIVTCAGLAALPGRAGSVVAAVNYFGSVEVLEGLRPLLRDGGAAVAISSNSTTVQPAIPAELVQACLDHDEERSGRIADEKGAMVTYPASKLALAHWVRTVATGPTWAGVGAPAQRRRPRHDRHPHGGQHARRRARRRRSSTCCPSRSDVRDGPRRSPPWSNSSSGPTPRSSADRCSSATAAATRCSRTRDWPAAWEIEVRDLGRQLS